MPLSYNDNRKYIPADQLRPSDMSGRSLIQPLNDDWLEMLASLFTYATSTKINVSDANVLLRFAIGDKLKITQSGTTSYFSVTKVNSTSINIIGDNASPFLAVTIDKIEFSRLDNPSGFPATFLYLASLTDEDGTPIPYTGAGLTAVYLRLRGNFAACSISIVSANIAANTSTIRISLPFPNTTTYNTFGDWTLPVRLYSVGPAAYASGLAKLAITSDSFDRIDAVHETSNWPTGELSGKFAHQFPL